MLVPEIYKQKYCKSIYKFVARVPLIVGSPLQMNEINRSDTQCCQNGLLTSSLPLTSVCLSEIKNNVAPPKSLISEWQKIVTNKYRLAQMDNLGKKRKGGTQSEVLGFICNVVATMNKGKSQNPKSATQNKVSFQASFYEKFFLSLLHCS